MIEPDIRSLWRCRQLLATRFSQQLNHIVVIPVLVLFSLMLTNADAVEPVFELESPAPGIYLHSGQQADSDEKNGGDIANVGFIVGDHSVMVIDPGGSPKLGRQLLAAVRDITNLPIAYTILTHIHPDHILGGQAFAGLGQIVAHRRYPAALTQRGQFYLDRFAYLMVNEIKALAIPDVLVKEQLTVDLGNRTVVIRAHKTAHTDHDLSVFDVNSNTLWASDLVFSERIPSLDGSVVGWYQVSKAFLNEKPELIIPGHGKPGTASEILSPQLRYLAKLLDEVRADVASNKRLADSVKTVARDEEPHWLLFEQYHSGNVTKSYAELEWE